MTGALLSALTLQARADVITDWNQRSAQIVAEARIGTPPAVRVMALVQTAAYEATRDASRATSTSVPAVDVAVAAAHRAALTQLLPAHRPALDAAFQAAVAHVPDDAVRAQQVALGERAAQRVLAERADEMPRTPERV